MYVFYPVYFRKNILMFIKKTRKISHNCWPTLIRSDSVWARVTVPRRDEDYCPNLGDSWTMWRANSCTDFIKSSHIA